MTALGERLAVSLLALGRIARRLQASLDGDAARFPVSRDRIRSEDQEASKVYDAFLQRFQQTSDHLLRKLFPRTLAAIQGNAEFLPIGDVLEGLHRAGLIDDPSIWMALIEIRNRLIHEYALTDAELADDINAAWSMAPALLAQVARIRVYAKDHKLVEGISFNDH